MSEFARWCAGDAVLLTLWNQLWNLSFDAVKYQLEEAFGEKAIDPRAMKIGLEFQTTRTLLEAKANQRGVYPPDLSIVAFGKLHLQYRKQPLTSQTLN